MTSYVNPAASSNHDLINEGDLLGPPWKLVDKWLHDCASNHEQCNKISQQGSWYPTRLLDLGSATESKIKLIETAKSPPDGRYVSLSHRWDADPAKLTKNTSDALLKEIKLASLSKTFQDAIRVTRRLSCRYLWIDSLCIIQGDPDDWRRESASMDQVYRNAMCNLSALGASAGKEGLLFPRDTDLASPTMVELEWRRYFKGPYRLFERAFWKLRVESMPLNLRGWVFQERHLAPRILHFGPDQLFWDCHGLRACEWYPKRLHIDMDGQTRLVNPRVDGGNPTPITQQDWYKLVEEYSRCDLTEDGDKLVAISGIAKIFQSCFKDNDYLAGLWRRDLVVGLLWRIPEYNSPVRRPDLYRAPSWSWASIDAEIRFQNCYDEVFLIDILDANVLLQSEDPTGQVKGGEIRLRGGLYKVGPMVEGRTYNYEVHGGEITVFSEIGLVPDRFLMSYCFPLNWRRPYVHGLLLEAAGDGQGVYRRIGMYRCWCQEMPTLKDGEPELYCKDQYGVLVII